MAAAAFSASSGATRSSWRARHVAPVTRAEGACTLAVSAVVAPPHASIAVALCSSPLPPAALPATALPPAAHPAAASLRVVGKAAAMPGVFRVLWRRFSSCAARPPFAQCSSPLPPAALPATALPPAAHPAAARQRGSLVSTTALAPPHVSAAALAPPLAAVAALSSRGGGDNASHASEQLTTAAALRNRWAHRPRFRLGGPGVGGLIPTATRVTGRGGQRGELSL